MSDILPRIFVPGCPLTLLPLFHHVIVNQTIGLEPVGGYQPSGSPMASLESGIPSVEYETSLKPGDLNAIIAVARARAEVAIRLKAAVLSGDRQSVFQIAT